MRGGSIDECVPRKDCAGAAVGQAELCIADKRRKLDSCEEKDHAGAAAAHAEMAQRRSASVHEEHDEKRRIGEKKERERKAKAEEYARNIDDLVAQKDYTGAAALQALMDALGSAADQAQEEHAAAGGAGALTSQEAKCEQEIGSCLARTDYASAAVAQSELAQHRSASIHEKTR